MTIGNENDRDRRIEDKVSRTVTSLDHIPPLPVPPYFADRVMAALAPAQETAWEGMFGMVFSRRLTPALLTIFLLANLATAWIAMRDADQSRTHGNSVESLAGQYRLDISNPFAPTMSR
jgi:hypothetical protein